MGGFASVPLTSIFGSTILTGYPFWNTPKALVADFYHKVVKAYGARWVFSLNIMTYFDPSNSLDAGSSDRCEEALFRSTCWNDVQSCTFPSIVHRMRGGMQNLTNINATLWITETGWSSPLTSSLAASAMSKCT